MHARRRRRAGSTMVELALVLPILLGLLVGIVDLGWLFHRQLMLGQAVRDGARAGAQGLDEGQVKAIVLDSLQAAGYRPVPAGSAIQVTYTPEQAQVEINVVAPVLFASSGPPVALRAVTRMRRG